MSVPKLRFKADDGSEFPEWEEYKAEQLFDNITDKNHSSETVLTIVQGTGTIPRSESGRNIQYDADYLSNYKRVQKNDFIIHLRSFEGGLEIANENGIVSPAYIILRNKLEIANPFYYAYFHTNSFICHNLAKAVEGIRDGRQISYAAFKTLKLPYCSFPEQNKIAELLTAVNKTIEQTQSEITAWEKQKRGVMQLLFSRKVRFKADDGSEFPELEEKKLNEIASMHARIGWQNLRKEEFLNQGDFLLITGTDFIDGKVNYETCHYISKERYDQDLNIQVENGTILITKDGTLGKVALITDLNMPATLNAGVFAVKPLNESILSNFLYYWLSAPMLLLYASEKSTGGTIKHLNQNILVDFPVSVPCIAEQQKIAACLSGFDDVIDKAKKELEAYRELKKGLLQQMFV